VFFATRKGTVKKTSLEAFSRPRSGGIWAIQLDEDDRLVGVGLAKPGDTILLATATGKAIRFDESAARAMGRQAHGVRGIKLIGDDKVVGMFVAADPEGTVFTACEHGHGKRTPLEDYPIRNRGGQGVINIRTEGRNGRVVGFDLAGDGDEVLFITESGMIVRSSVAGIRPMGRSTQGVRLINLKSEDKLVGAEIIQAEDLEIPEGEVADGPETLAPVSSVESSAGGTREPEVPVGDGTEEVASEDEPEDKGEE
jgi:DNA gyrase subunit A